MKKGIGCLILILVLLLITILKSTTGVTHGGTGMIGAGILVALVMFGWSLIKSKKDDSSNDNTDVSTDKKTYDTVNKQNEVLSNNKDSIEDSKKTLNTENINNENETKANEIIIPEIEKIKRQYEKGVFSENEKDDLIEKILTQKQNEEIEKIKEKYKFVLQPFKKKYNHLFKEESIEINELHNQGVIDKITLNEKLNTIKLIVAKKIQKEIKFKSMLAIEIYQGVVVRKEKPSFFDDWDDRRGRIIEIVNSNEVKVLWDNGGISKPLSLDSIIITDTHKEIDIDWDLDKNNFLFTSNTSSEYENRSDFKKR